MNNLLRYSFLWSLARLVLGAIALLLGGVPVLAYIVRVPSLYGVIGAALNLSWMISGLASLYLIYEWNLAGRKVFGGEDRIDTIAFFIMIVTGINLGLAGLLSNNIGMSIANTYPVFIITAVVYLACAWYLHKRWKESGERLFL